MRRAKFLFPNLVMVFGALLLSLVLLPVVSARPAHNVSLVYFRGQGLDNAARLEWRTVSEENTAAFKIERADSQEGPFTFLSDIGIIAARGSVSSGDTYEATDNSAVNGQTYWYRLIEIEYDNSEHVLHTTEVSVEPPPTPEPVGGGSSGGTNTPVPTSTSPATSTPQGQGDDDEDSNGANDTPEPTATSTSNGQTTTTPRATAPSPTPGNRPTNTPPPPPTPMTFNPNNNNDSDDVAEAAGLTVEADVVAQVTPGTDPYPSPEDEEESSSSTNTYPAPSDSTGESSSDIPAAPSEGYPSGSGSGNSGGAVVGDGRAVGSDNDAADAQESQQEESSTAGRVLLWVGFIVALLVFVGGVVFTIMLSTRQRHNNP